MLPQELLKAVKHLEIVAKRAVNETLAGQYESVFKGRGMDFTGVREYQPGDDIRVIDWNVSARMNELYIKQYIEERELTVFLLVDASASQAFATDNLDPEGEPETKQDTAATLAALLAFSAIENNDRVGLMTFTDEIESLIPPQKGKKHVLRVISEILNFNPKGERTDISRALERLSHITHKRAVVFLISDFLDDGVENILKVVQSRHELVPIMLSDPMERALPDSGMGLVMFEDPETGEVLEVDTSNSNVLSAYQDERRAYRERWSDLFKKYEMDPIEIHTEEDHIEPLVEYFQRRAKRY